MEMIVIKNEILHCNVDGILKSKEVTHTFTYGIHLSPTQDFTSMKFDRNKFYRKNILLRTLLGPTEWAV